MLQKSTCCSLVLDHQVINVTSWFQKYIVVMYFLASKGSFQHYWPLTLMSFWRSCSLMFNAKRNHKQNYIITCWTFFVTFLFKYLLWFPSLSDNNVQNDDSMSSLTLTLWPFFKSHELIFNCEDTGLYVLWFLSLNDWQNLSKLCRIYRTQHNNVAVSVFEEHFLHFGFPLVLEIMR